MFPRGYNTVRLERPVSGGHPVSATYEQKQRAKAALRQGLVFLEPHRRCKTTDRGTKNEPMDFQLTVVEQCSTLDDILNAGHQHSVEGTSSSRSRVSLKTLKLLSSLPMKTIMFRKVSDEVPAQKDFRLNSDNSFETILSNSPSLVVAVSPEDNESSGPPRTIIFDGEGNFLLNGIKRPSLSKFRVFSEISLQSTLPSIRELGSFFGSRSSSEDEDNAKKHDSNDDDTVPIHLMASASDSFEDDDDEEYDLRILTGNSEDEDDIVVPVVVPVPVAVPLPNNKKWSYFHGEKMDLHIRKKH